MKVWVRGNISVFLLRNSLEAWTLKDVFLAAEARLIATICL